MARKRENSKTFIFITECSRMWMVSEPGTLADFQDTLLLNSQISFNCLPYILTHLEFFVPKYFYEISWLLNIPF